MPPISFTRAVSYYDSTRGYPDGVAEKIRDAILTTTHAHPNTQFLEIGVGTGLIALPFIQAGCAYTGVDISREMMAELERKLVVSQTEPERISHRHRLLQADATRLPFRDHSFDIVIAVHVFHLLENWQLALREIRRVLRESGGRLMIGRDESANNDTDSARLVHSKWDDILQQLDIAPGTLRTGLWLKDETIEKALQESGAAVELVDLVQYNRAPYSLRTMAERHKDRLHSRDWDLPDPIHSEAVQRLEKWLNEEAPEPDKLLVTQGIFRALSVHWLSG